MLISYKYRLYPSNYQKVLINKNINACRLVYNLALETKKHAYISHQKKISCFDLIKQLPDLKKEHNWLKEGDSSSLQQSIIDVNNAFVKFFKGSSKYPKFKNKKESCQSFRNPHGNRVDIIGNKISQPKFKEGIKFVQERAFSGEIKSTTISRTSTGKYFISVLVEPGKKNPVPKLINENTTIGIDLGLKHLIITSDGIKIDNPKYLRNSIERLKVLQRRLRNKKKGSNNKKKAFRRIALLHEKIANQRKDFLHKLSSQLVNNHDTLCMEDLNVEGMVKNHKLALSISDSGWGEFVRQCKYKAEWSGKNVLQIPTFEPSTKVCSDCGQRNDDLTLADREWTCLCGITHDRDINAAINIKNYCIRNSGKVIPGVPVESRTKVRTKKQEVEKMTVCSV